MFQKVVLQLQLLVSFTGAGLALAAALGSRHKNLATEWGRCRFSIGVLGVPTDHVGGSLTGGTPREVCGYTAEISMQTIANMFFQCPLIFLSDSFPFFSPTPHKCPSSEMRIVRKKNKYTSSCNPYRQSVTHHFHFVLPLSWPQTQSIAVSFLGSGGVRKFFPLFCLQTCLSIPLQPPLSVSLDLYTFSFSHGCPANFALSGFPFSPNCDK